MQNVIMMENIIIIVNAIWSKIIIGNVLKETNNYRKFCYESIKFVKCQRTLAETTSNRGPLVSEATALPSKPQPLPSHRQFFIQYMFGVKNKSQLIF